VDSGIDPKEYLLAVTHGSRVERAGVDDWRSRLVTAENDQEIADHRCLALLVKVDDVALIKPFECHFHHPDGALDNARTGRDDGMACWRRSIAWAISGA
jgi:hypothetical protein